MFLCCYRQYNFLSLNCQPNFVELQEIAYRQNIYSNFPSNNLSDILFQKMVDILDQLQYNLIYKVNLMIFFPERSDKYDR